MHEDHALGPDADGLAQHVTGAHRALGVGGGAKDHRHELLVGEGARPMLVQAVVGGRHMPNVGLQGQHPCAAAPRYLRLRGGAVPAALAAAWVGYAL